MAHKTITISAVAYAALSNLKAERESFTDVILRLAAEKEGGKNLLRFVKSLAPDEDLARSLESAMRWRRTVRFRGATV